MTGMTAKQPAEGPHCKNSGHLSMLLALVEAAQDIKAGRVYSWDEFKPRLARLRARAKRVAVA
jgi:hypothetical protein